MSGNQSGGLKAKAANLKNDPDFYRKLGSAGGSAPHKTRTFATNHDLAVRAGAIGGAASRRKWSKAQREEMSKKMRKTK